MSGGARRFASLDFTRVGLAEVGFGGFQSVRELRRLPEREWPVPADKVGLYLAYRDSDARVAFRTRSPAGRWAGDPTLPLAELRRRWVDGAHVVYIGSASRPTPTSTNSLRTRLSAYLRFGAGGNARHRGGYPTWQLTDADRLLIAWLVVRPPARPVPWEHDLLSAHFERFGALPFANSVF